MSKKKKINKGSQSHPHKRDKKDSKKDHETFIVGEELNRKIFLSIVKILTMLLMAIPST